MSLIVKVCRDCSPRRVEEKTKYWGPGECQACGRADAELHGHSLGRVLGALRAAQENASGDLAFRGNVLEVDLWYPRLEYGADRTPRTFDHPVAVEVGLTDVRAADSILVEYDFDRDGWVIKQASKFSWEVDDKVCDPDWQEVAFVQAWGRQVDPAPETERNT